MVFVLEEEDEGDQPGTESCQGSRTRIHLLKGCLDNVLRPCSLYHQQLVADVHLIQGMTATRGGEMDVELLGSHLAAAGYSVILRRAVGGGPSTKGLTTLSHSFLLVTPPHCPGPAACFVVEPCFREQFEISDAPATYTAMLQLLPPVMVCMAVQLVPLVRLVSWQILLAFEERGMPLPPWRFSRSLLSKWLPTKVQDFQMAPDGTRRAVVAIHPIVRANPVQPLVSLSWEPPGRQTLRQAQHEAHSHSQSEAHSQATPGNMSPAFASSLHDESPRAVLSSVGAHLLCKSPAGNARPSLAQHQSGKRPEVQHLPHTGGTSAAAPAHSLLSNALQKAVAPAAWQRDPLQRCLERTARRTAMAVHVAVAVMPGNGSARGGGRDASSTSASSASSNSPPMVTIHLPEWQLSKAPIS